MGLAISPALYPLLVNCRAYVPGVLESRSGIVAVNSNNLGATVHSLKRLNDPLPGATAAYAILAGAGPNLYLGTVTILPSVFALADAGYSGKPLAFVTYRPPNSPESWLYISDSLQNRKINTAGQAFPAGIASPVKAPLVDFAQPLLTVIDDFNEAATTGWAATGNASALSANPTGRISLPLSYSGLSSGPGWVNYVRDPTLPLTADFGVGARLVINAGLGDAETVTISRIFPNLPPSTIAEIMFDSGTTGECTIQPVNPSSLVASLARRGQLSKLTHSWPDPFTAGANLTVQPNARVSISGGAGEVVLVQSSTPGPLGVYSFRANCKFTHAPGEVLELVSSFRAWDTKAHADPVLATAGYFRVSVATGIGALANATLPLDLSIIGGRPAQPEDEFHMSVRLDVPANLVEGRIILDVDSTTNDFAHNYYYFAFRANDLTSAVANATSTLSAVQTSISNAQVDQFRNQYPAGYYQQVLGSNTNAQNIALTPSSGQASTGNSQWTELFFKISDLIRVGADTSRTLANVKAVAIQFNVSGTTVCDVHGLYLKGSYGPDVGVVGSDYYYRHRERSTLTGAMSNPGPYQRSGIRPHGERLQITVPGSASEGDQIDVFRYGGAVPAGTGGVPWLRVGNVPNPGQGNTAVFNDDFADSDILNAEVLEFDNFQPFPTLDIPRQGLCQVVGTSVRQMSGDKFNPRWAMGSLIEINGTPYTLYTQPRSATFLEIVESGTSEGAGSSISTTQFPSGFLNPAVGGQTPFCDPAAAENLNATTAALAACHGTLLSQIAPGETSSCDWFGFPALPPTWSNLTLYVLSGSLDFTGGQLGHAKVEYSLDGGATYITLWDENNHHTAFNLSVLDSVNLPLTQDLAMVHVRATGSNSDTGGYESFGVNEIYITGTYQTTVLLPVPFILRQPTLLAQPLYAEWGPFNGYLMACGDPYQPGVLHCTKPNQPDEASDQLDVEVTTPSEPLMNGTMFSAGASFCWSDQRMFQLYPSTDVNLQFTTAGPTPASIPFVPVEVPGSDGLYAPWFFCVGDKIYYGTKSGIVATQGGTPVSITDPYLTKLFPHDGQAGMPVTLGAVTFQPPDFTMTANLRLFFEPGHVKFAYIDLTGVHRVIVYNVLLGVWSVDDYVTTSDPDVSVLYSEEAASVNRNLVGGNGFVYRESGDLEAGNAQGFQIHMPQVGDSYGFTQVRDGYVAGQSSAQMNLIINGDGVDYAHPVGATGVYLRQYTVLQSIKAKTVEWAITSTGATRIWMRDTTFRAKRWADQQYQPFQPFRDLLRELKG